MAGGRVQAEGDVRQAERRVDAGQVLLDEPDALEGGGAVAPALLHARAEGEGERVEEQVAGLEAVAVDGDVVDGLGGLELPLGRAGLALLVDAGADDGGAVLAGQRQEAVEPGARRVAVLEVDRVEDGPAADPLQGRLDDLRLGGVDHERDGGLGGEARRDLVHVGAAVAADVVDADVEDVGALLLLLAGHRHAHVPVALEHGLAELLGAVGVRALTDREVGELLLERREAVDGGGAVLVLEAARRGRDVLDRVDQRGDVLDGGAAAAAHHLHAEVAHEAALELGQLVRREVVVHLPFDHRRQAGVREARDRHARVLPEVAEVLAHLGRARGAVDADDVGAHGVEGGQGGTDLGAREHGARELHRDLHLDRHLAARRGHRPAAADHPGLGAEQVELGLDEEQVDPALEEAGRLLLVRIAELGEPDLTEGGELGARAHRAGDEPPVAVGHLAGDARRGEVDLVRSLRDPVLGERHGEGAEGGGLHDVDADLEELVVHRGDHVGAGDDEQLVAALEVVAPEVVGTQAQGLHVGAEGAVVDDDLLVDEIEVAAGTHGLARLPGRPRGPVASRTS